MTPGSWGRGAGRGCSTRLEIHGRGTMIPGVWHEVHRQPKQCTERYMSYSIPQLYQRNLIFQEEKKMRRSGDLYPPFHDQQPLLASYNVIMWIPSVLNPKECHIQTHKPCFWNLPKLQVSAPSQVKLQLPSCWSLQLFIKNSEFFPNM